MVPDIQYPNLLQSFGNVSGGKVYKAPIRGAQQEFGEVVRIDLSQLDSTYASYTHALQKELVVFPNNYAICARMWTDGNFVFCKWVSINKTTGNLVHEFDPSGTGSMQISIPGGTLTVPLLAARTWGAVFYVTTDFFDPNAYPYDGQSASKIDITMRFPSSDGHDLNNLSQYSSGVKRLTAMADSDPKDPYYTLCLDYPTGNGVVCGVNVAISDIDSFLNGCVNGGGPNPYRIGGPNPPQDDDPSEPGGGDGDYDPTSDPIDFPGLPTGGALSSGAIKAFLVNEVTMSAVFNKLWNTSIFDISNWQKLLEAPLDSLIELECIPVTPTLGSNANIKFGNFDTEVAAPVITNQYLTIDCGSIQVKRFWGSALDYEPYTKVEIFLPFIGIKGLHTDDVMNSTVHVKYNIDILTGTLTAQIKCGPSVLYKYEGNCKATVPVTSRVMDALRTFLMGNAAIALASTPAGVATATITAAVNVAMSKTHVTRSGDISGATGLLDDFVPYIIIHRPVQSLPQGFKSQKGYPSNISGLLSSLSGYTEVEYIHLTGISGATDTELAEIEELLKSGVII